MDLMTNLFLAIPVELLILFLETSGASQAITWPW